MSDHESAFCICVLVSLLGLGLPDAAPVRRTDVHLRGVLADSLCVDATGLGCSPVILLGDQTHFRTIFVDTKLKKVYFFDPMGTSLTAS